jgi:hypothetical protein
VKKVQKTDRRELKYAHIIKDEGDDGDNINNDDDEYDYL